MSQVSYRSKSSATDKAPTKTLLFGRRNYYLLIGGIVVMGLGYLFMLGGQQPPDQWDTKVIYGFTRITLSTLLVAAGLVLLLVSIFARTRSKG